MSQPDPTPPISGEFPTTAGNDTGNDSGEDARSWLESVRVRLGIQDPRSLRETLEHALKVGGECASEFSPQEREMLLRTLRFGALRVDDVMVPRADIVAIDENLAISELLRLFNEAGHSRIPVYRETLDDLLGMIHIKDFVEWLGEGAGIFTPRNGSTNGNKSPALQRRDGSSRDRIPQSSDVPIDAQHSRQEPIAVPHNLSGINLSKPISSARLRRDVFFVPASMPAVNLLLRMQSTRVHLAMVVDEYGGTDGLVSIEDLVEEIVGDIEDEHDEEEGDLIFEDAQGNLIADARLPISELEAFLGVTLITDDDDDDVDTLGGLIFALVGRVPLRGELISHVAGFEFEVLDADPRRITKLRIHRHGQRATDGGNRSATRSAGDTGASGSASRSSDTVSPNRG